MRYTPARLGMHQDNPFNNLNDLPNRRLTAALTVLFWLALAAVLFIISPSPLNWISASAVVLYAARTWRRFRTME